MTHMETPGSGGEIVHVQRSWKDRVANAIPQLGKLLYRIARDPRVPRRHKMVAVALAAYGVMPFDIIPDWLPGIGQLDDLVLIALSFDTLLNRIPEEVLRDHWEGDTATLDTIRSLLATATSFVPDKVKNRLITGEDDDEM